MTMDRNMIDVCELKIEIVTILLGNGVFYVTINLNKFWEGFYAIS